MRISDWSSDVCSSDLGLIPYRTAAECIDWSIPCPSIFERKRPLAEATLKRIARGVMRYVVDAANPFIVPIANYGAGLRVNAADERSEEHTSELQSLMRISYAVFCLKKKTTKKFIICTSINQQVYKTQHCVSTNTVMQQRSARTH